MVQNGMSVIETIMPIPAGETWWIMDGQPTFQGETFRLLGFQPFRKVAYVLKERADEAE